MPNLDEILELLDGNKFKEAEQALLELRRKDIANPGINYLLGYLYNDYKNPNHSPR